MTCDYQANNIYTMSLSGRAGISLNKFKRFFSLLNNNLTTNFWHLSLTQSRVNENFLCGHSFIPSYTDCHLYSAVWCNSPCKQTFFSIRAKTTLKLLSRHFFTAWLARVLVGAGPAAFTWEASPQLATLLLPLLTKDTLKKKQKHRD